MSEKKHSKAKKTAGESAKKRSDASRVQKSTATKATKKELDELDNWDVPAPKKKKSSSGKPAQHSRRAKRLKARRRRRAKRIFYGTASAIFGIACAVLLFFGVASTMRYFDFLEMRAYLDRDTFYPGMVVDGVDLSGYTLADALDAFRDRERDYAKTRGLAFTADGEEYPFSAEQLGFGSNYSAVVKGAWDIGRKGTLAQRYAAAQGGCNYTVARGFDENTLRQVTAGLAASLTTQSVDATVEGFIWDEARFAFSEEKQGSYVDPEELYRQAVLALEQGGQVEIQRVAVAPNVTAEMLSSRYGELTSATTNASSSNSNRINNIRLACASINGLCLQPGEEFSFNGVVGQRTEKAGYKVAGVYVSGELGEEIGGGICQVSTTLFNAVVKADLEVTERHNHSLPVSYVDNGKDATVSWGVQDFKFVNSSDEPVYIAAQVTDNKRVKIYIYGKLRTDGLTISVVPVLQETVKPGKDTYQYTTEIPTGTTRVKTKARNGYRVNTYKAYTDANGNVVDKVFLCSSYYPAKGAVIEVGS